MNKRLMQRIAGITMSCCLISSVFGSMTVQAESPMATTKVQQGSTELKGYGYVDRKDLSTYVDHSISKSYSTRVSTVEQRVKEELQQRIYLRERTIDLINYNITLDMLVPLIQEVLNDNPEYYWVTGGYGYSYYINALGQRIVTHIEFGYTNVGNQDAFEKETAKILSYITDGMSEFEKAKRVHDYMVYHYEYSKAYTTGNFTSEDYSVYGLFVNKEGVCQAYAQAYRYLMKLVGIPCEFVVSMDMNHMWNMIQLDKKWYHVDATWDDPVPNVEGRVLYNNFLKSDAEIEAQGHYNWEANHVADSTKYDQYTFAKPAEFSATNPITSFQLKENRIELMVGGQQSLNVDSTTVVPAGAASKIQPKYVSLRDSIVSVNENGRITANAEGQAVVIVMTDGITRACMVNVVPGTLVSPTPSATPSPTPSATPTQKPTPKPVKAESIKVSQSKVNLYVGGTTTLKVSILPSNTTNKAVTWTSSNAKVASVSKDGKVTAHKNGAVTITATMQDGSKRTASCKVTVQSKITYKLNGGKNGKNPDSYAGDKTITLNNPSRAGYTFEGWYSDSTLKKAAAKITKGTSGNKVFYAKWKKVSKPAKAGITSVKSTKSKQLALGYKKITGASGYEVSYSTSSKFTKSTTKTVTTTKSSITVSKLQSKKQYYVRVRAYKTDSTGKKHYGSYSAVKKIKIK